MIIEIVPYRDEWPEEFAAAAAGLHDALGDVVKGVHHVGSTSIPGLAAKDIIDVQVTVSRVDEELRRAIAAAGYDLKSYEHDHSPPKLDVAADELQKAVASQRPGERPANFHFRRAGAFNHDYALMFRDYLREFPAAAAAYGQVKQALAKHFSDDVDAYYDVKDPAIDMLMVGARLWAEDTGWAAPPSDA